MALERMPAFPNTWLPSCSFSAKPQLLEASSLWQPSAVFCKENICNRNYVMVCGPGEDGQRGERIPKGGKKGKGKAGCRVAFYCLLSSAFLDLLVASAFTGQRQGRQSAG